MFPGAIIQAKGTEAKLLEDVEERVEDGVELQPPDWLPDGMVMQVTRGDDGTPYQVHVSMHACIFPVVLFGFEIYSMYV